MRKLGVAAIVWIGFLAGLLAVAIANRPDHETVFTPGAGKSGLDRLIGGTTKEVPASPLAGWTSGYTLALVLVTIALAVGLVLWMSMRNQEHAR
jgi:hypothetical protein